MYEVVIKYDISNIKCLFNIVCDNRDVAAAERNKHATIEEPCPKCKHPTLYFYTMQLRSVDEGSTVFYECPKCAHKFSQNN